MRRRPPARRNHPPGTTRGVTTMTARRNDWPSTEDKLETLHYQLIEAVADLASSQAWMTMLRVAARFRDYSPSNVLLIAAQRPDATPVSYTHLRAHETVLDLVCRLL